MYPMKLKLSTIVILALATSASLGAAEKLTTGTINVISTTPLPSIGLPLNIIPANIQIVNRADLKNQAGVSIVDFANNNLQGVSIQETQGNPFQPDVTFRGYSASPLGGAPQGISVFLDGVRMNEPFGDTVRWDLVPTFAIQGMQMVPGSNPVYGLNTLGGAIAIQTKSGRLNQGAALEASAGSWGRKNVSAEYGGVSKDGSVDYFFGVNYLDEDGWRKYSPTTVKQTFGKVGWQSESTKIDLSYLNVNNDLIGNGLVPQELMTGLGRDAIHTRPDQTRNSLNQITLNGSHWLNNNVMFSANTYYRRSNQKTLNGDVNDTFCPADDTGSCADPATSTKDLIDNNQAVFNSTRTRTNAFGLSAQLAFNQDIFNKKNQLIVGTGIDRSISKFGQFEQEFQSWDSTRYPSVADDVQETSTNFKGKTITSSVFATDTLSINELVHVTGGLRYNYSKVNNKDFLVGTDDYGTADAGGRHTFSRVNPSLGLTLTPNQNVSIFGSYSESNRAPTAMELACADPLNPCLLPNAMASDPPLKQVVAKTYDLGAKGNLGANFKWNASVYQAVNHNDLQFIHAGTNASMGYFDNVGKTKRQGLDLGLSAKIDKLSLTGSYGYIRAIYDDGFTLTSESNSSRVDDTVINVNKGNYLAGIPKHQFKLRAEYEVIPTWTVGANLVAFSSRYMHGNENNGHQANSAACAADGDEIPCGKGKTSGYAIVNLDTRYKVGGGWQVFAKAINIFDKDYETTGRLGMTHFDAAGSWMTDYADDYTSGSRLVSPGAPRAGWIGVRYEFGGAPEAK
ncbi:TonB-dependent receptor [Candidatus Methylopumilus universalis]|nr:TonB-dependent receptor [Candidatus Methylopumilus universalis]